MLAQQAHVVIPLPPHRTKGGVVVGARGPGDHVPFGVWGADTEPEVEEGRGGSIGWDSAEGRTAPPQYAGDDRV
ncbi:hypothetical protein [Streptomyces hygroscopicus]|uniref:hypothetical protein n=1 Tax=Streptomyces hygroscopicus TaxID=1912 RepID=UPI0036D08A95